MHVGIGNFGCYAHVALRRALCAMFWVDESDHQPDFEIDLLDPNSTTMALAMYRRDQKNRRGNQPYYTTPSLGIHIMTICRLTCCRSATIYNDEAAFSFYVTNIPCEYTLLIYLLYPLDNDPF